MHIEPVGNEPVDHVLNLFVTSARMHHHNHCSVSPKSEFQIFKSRSALRPFFRATRSSFFMMRSAFERARLINNSLEKPPNRGIGQRPRIRALDIPQNFVLPRRLIDRQTLQMFLVADLESAIGALVQQRQEFQINFIYAAAPIIDAHDGFSLPAGIPRWLTPDLPACFKVRIKFPTASAARSGVAAFSISATIAEPTTAASAMPPRRVTCVGCEIPNPTAIGKRVRCRTRRTNAGKSSGRASRVPVTPVREIKYRNPEDAAAIFANRASVEVGAARKIVSRLCARRIARYSPASSGVRSVTNTPSAPAFAASAANFSNPICKIGLK